MLSLGISGLYADALLSAGILGVQEGQCNSRSYRPRKSEAQHAPSIQGIEVHKENVTAVGRSSNHIAGPQIFPRHEGSRPELHVGSTTSWTLNLRITAQPQLQLAPSNPFSRHPVTQPASQSYKLHSKRSALPHLYARRCSFAA